MSGENGSSAPHGSGAKPLSHPVNARRAAEDVEAHCGGVDNVRTALEDIQNLRMTKIRNGLQTIARQARNDATTFSVKMNNVGALEILSVRSFLTGARARL